MAYKKSNPNGQATMANSEPVVIASDQSALTVDLGANNDVTVTGTVTANLSATDNAVLDQIELNTDPLLVVGGGAEATAIRVTVANDSTGVISVDDNGSALTVDGTVTANLSATDNAVLDAIEADTTTIAGAVSGTEMQVDIVSSALPTGASTLAEQQTQTTHLATIAGDTTDIETAVELIDDTVATLGTTTYTEAATKGLIIGAVRRDADTTLVDTTNEVTALQVDASGRLKVEAFSGETLPVSLTSTTVTGTVAVTQSGTWDEVGINDSGNSITVDNAQLSVVGSGTEATAMRVTIATDSTGVLSVDDNGSTISVDDGAGSITVDQPTGSNLHTVVDSGTITTVSTVTALGTGTTGPMKAEDVAHSTGDMGIPAWGVSNEANTARAADGDYIPFATDTEGNTRNVGNRDHDAVDAGEPVKIGFKAVDLGATPTAVAAADRTDSIALRNGIQFVMAGHPNTLSQSLQITDADGAQTDTAIVTAAAGTSIVVTKVSVMADNANTTDVSVRIGFGTANTPAVDAAKVLLFHPGIAAGSGVVEGTGAGIIGIGASDEDLRVTCEDPASGSINIIVTYFTVAIG